jgi:hypothetical protein
MKMHGVKSATTFPANMGLLAPKLSTLRVPLRLWAVASHAINEQASPRGGLSMAAHLFCLLHSRVRAAGRTADETMTPIIRYKKPFIYVSLEIL